MSDITIQFDGKEYELDDFELGDLEWLEDYIGRPLNDNDAMNSMKAAVGIAFLIKRRDEPAFTIEQARKLKLAVLTAPEDEPATKRPPKRAAAH